MKMLHMYFSSKNSSYFNFRNKMKSHMNILFFDLTCSKHIYIAIGNYTLYISFYKRETKIKKKMLFGHFDKKKKKNNSVAFSLLFSIFSNMYTPFL